MGKEASGVACGQVKAPKYIEFRYIAASSFSWDISKQSHKNTMLYCAVCRVWASLCTV